MTPTVNIVKEAIDDLSTVLDTGTMSYQTEAALLKVVAKLTIVAKRLTDSVVQQETKRYIPDNPFKRSDPELASKVSELIFNSDKPYR